MDRDRESGGKLIKLNTNSGEQVLVNTARVGYMKPYAGQTLVFLDMLESNGKPTVLTVVETMDHISNLVSAD